MVNRSRSIKQKRTRRTRAQTDNLKEWVEAILLQIKPATVRQLFYQLSKHGAIEKTEGEYKNVVIRLLTQMRLDGSIPFDWIVDNTRWMRKPRSYSSVEALLNNTLTTYRRSVWDQQFDYVEIWLEKDALAGVFYEVTSQWDCPLMVTKGFASLSFLHSAAEEIKAQSEQLKECHIYYFGDHDPSGRKVDESIERHLRSFCGDIDFSFERMAVEQWQIEAWGLPTRPTKKSGTHAKTFEGDSVELDSIEPDQLKRLIENCILRNIHTLIAAEESERETLTAFFSTFQDYNGGDVDHAS